MVLEHYKTELELAQYVSKLEAQVKGYRALCERLQAQADEMRSVKTEVIRIAAGNLLAALMKLGMCGGLQYCAGQSQSEGHAKDAVRNAMHDLNRALISPAAPTPTNGDGQHE